MVRQIGRRGIRIGRFAQPGHKVVAVELDCQVLQRDARAKAQRVAAAVALRVACTGMRVVARRVARTCVRHIAVDRAPFTVVARHFVLRVGVGLLVRVRRLPRIGFQEPVFVMDRVGTVAAAEHINIVSGTALKRVAARTTDQHVTARAAHQRVRSRSARQPVRTRTTGQRLRRRPAELPGQSRRDIDRRTVGERQLLDAIVRARPVRDRHAICQCARRCGRIGGVAQPDDQIASDLLECKIGSRYTGSETQRICSAAPILDPI